jgi:plastocyanin
MRHLKALLLALLATLLLGLGLAPMAIAWHPAAPQTYTVLVGAENAHRGIDVMAYFPNSVTIHVGDSIHWIQNSNEIHTVTFLGTSTPPPLLLPAKLLGLPEVPSPLVFNPGAVNQTTTGTLGDTTTFVNSGLMGHETGQYGSFDLTFTAAGTYNYECLVHGAMMSGTITAVAPCVRVASPCQVRAQANFQIARQMAQAPAVLREAVAQIKPPTMNPDGTWTHYVGLGFGKGQIDFMRFFPRKLLVRPGDTVVWEMTPFSDAPHTVTFFNGQPDPGLVIPVPQASGPPVLYISPTALFPYAPAPVLTRTGAYNSGLLLPVPGTTSSLKIGDMTPGPLLYQCQLHDTSGMKGTLIVLPH